MVSKRLALVCLSITILSTVSRRGDAQLNSEIDTICKVTVDYGYCSSVLHQDLPDGKPTTVGDLNELTKLQALARVTDALGAVRASGPKEKDPSVGERLKGCEDAYSAAEYTMKQSFLSFIKQDYPNMVRLSQDALSEQMGCYESFKKDPFDKHPVYQTIKEVMVLFTADVMAGAYLH